MYTLNTLQFYQLYLNKAVKNKTNVLKASLDYKLELIRDSPMRLKGLHQYENQFTELQALLWKPYVESNFME